MALWPRGGPPCRLPAPCNLAHPTPTPWQPTFPPWQPFPPSLLPSCLPSCPPFPPALLPSLPPFLPLLPSCPPCLPALDPLPGNPLSRGTHMVLRPVHHSAAEWLNSVHREGTRDRQIEGSRGRTEPHQTLITLRLNSTSLADTIKSHFLTTFNN